MAESLPVRLTLASASPARRYLLGRDGYSFDVRPADINEPRGEGVTDIRAFVQQVAWSKAAAVAPQVADGIVLAADTVAWIDGRRDRQAGRRGRRTAHFDEARR